jgi:hypothetical protein
MGISKMWMCTGPQGAWVPCPTSPLTRTKVGNKVETLLMNGGTYVNDVGGNHLKFEMGWLGTIPDLQPIKDMYDGIYGPGPFYFIDPTNQLNALPPHWAAPSLSGTQQWPTLVKGVVPVYGTTTISSIYTPPPLQATYTFNNPVPVFDTSTPRLTLPIPPTQNLNFRVWGQRTGTAVIRANTYNRASGALSTTDIAPLPTGITASFSGATYSHVELWLTKTTTTASALVLGAMLATVSTSTTTASVWSGGQGHTGVKFQSELSESVYRAWGAGWTLASATMVEVGTWLPQ